MSTIKPQTNEIDKLLKGNEYAKAIELLQRMVRESPNNVGIKIKLGSIFEKTKRFDQAVAIYSSVLRQFQEANKPMPAEFLIGLSNSLLRTRKYKESLGILEKLYKSNPNLPTVNALQSNAYRELGDFDKAEKFARKAVTLDSDSDLARLNMAYVLIHDNKIEEAVVLLEKNFCKPDLDGDSLDLWIKILKEANKNRYAQEKLEELSKKYPDKVEFIFGFAVLANRAGEASLAKPAFRRAMELSPNNPRILYELGVLERVAGNLEESQKLIGQSLDLKPDSPSAIRTFNSDIKLAYGDPNFKRLNYVAANMTDFSSLEQIHLHYALAKAYEDVEELDTAFRHYGNAGAKKRKLEKYSEKDASRLNAMIPKVVTKSKLASTNQEGFHDKTPVFILGMPRSGTSLMEQVLSAHPDVFGAGELKILTGVLENIAVGGNRLRMGDKDPVFPYDQNATWDSRGRHYVERIKKLADKPCARIVDKMPGNFNFVGLIHSILPDAKIIHSRRHPIETCLSCYRIHFAEGHTWTYNLRELGRFYRRYWELMDYWRNEFPNVMFEVKYEENVADIESQAKKLINYLELEWNDACLEFYNVDRPVKTASVTQVRKPIYNTSTNRWRKYEKYLGPLIDEIGDIVELYESEISHLLEKKYGN